MMNNDSRQIARAVLSFPFEPQALAAQTDRSAVQMALDGYRAAMVPALKLTRGERQADQAELAKMIRTIGLRIRPDFAEDQARMWIAAMVESLEDLPLRIAIAATKDAKHMPIRFPGEVLGIIQDKAKPHLLTYERAIRNLEKLIKCIDSPAQLEASSDAKAKAAQIAEADLQDMAPPFRSLGISAGWLRENLDGSIRWASDDEQKEHQAAQDERQSRRRARERADR